MNTLRKKSTHSKQHIESLTSAADKAKAQLAALQQSLFIDDDIPQKHFKALVALQHVPTEALAVAAALLEKYEASFPTFDLPKVKEALAYEIQMKEVAAQALELSQRLHKSVMKRRGSAVEQTFALYAALKAVARTDGTLAPSVKRLGDLIVPKRKAGAAKKASNAAASTAASAPAASPTPKPVTPPPASMIAPTAPGPSVTNGAAASIGSALNNGIAH